MNESTTKQAILTFTNEAVTYLTNRVKIETALGVRVSIKKAGCSNLKYDLAYVNTRNPADVIMDVSSDLTVFIDKAAVPYIFGAEIDYVKHGINRKIIFNNPNESSSCGCGESFNV